MRHWGAQGGMAGRGPGGGARQTSRHGECWSAHSCGQLWGRSAAITPASHACVRARTPAPRHARRHAVLCCALAPMCIPACATTLRYPTQLSMPNPTPTPILTPPPADVLLYRVVQPGLFRGVAVGAGRILAAGALHARGRRLLLHRHVHVHVRLPRGCGCLLWQRLAVAANVWGALAAGYGAIGGQRAGREALVATGCRLVDRGGQGHAGLSAGVCGAGGGMWAVG